MFHDGVPSIFFLRYINFFQKDGVADLCGVFLEPFLYHLSL